MPVKRPSMYLIAGKRFRKMPQEAQREHADDLRDLRGRLLREMAGVKTTGLEKMPQKRVLVAPRLLPSENWVIFTRDSMTL